MEWIPGSLTECVEEWMKRKGKKLPDDQGNHEAFSKHISYLESAMIDVESDLERDRRTGTLKTAVLFLFMVLAWALPARAEKIVEVTESHKIANILYAEAANDTPAGWKAKLNTYYKAKRPREGLLASMERVSSAYRTNSRQYRKASSGNLNAYEQKIYKNILVEVNRFSPYLDWPYIHHEDFSFYASRKAALAHLRRAWGRCVDFDNCVKIGREYYFRRV